MQPHTTRRIRRALAATVMLIAFTALTSACATSFTGSAHVPGGVQECKAKCQQQGLVLAGMVFMGEYTDGCICATKGNEQAALDAAGNAAAGASGVVMQMRRAQQQQQQQQMMH